MQNDKGQIIVQDLRKAYQISQREPGLIGAFKGLVHRKYKTIHALDGISFKIQPGELVGYLGPNAAGKSTSIKILCGILVPDSGMCQVNQLTPWKSRIAHVKNIGVVFGQRTQLWWDLPVIESFALLKDIYSVDFYTFKRKQTELIDALSLGSILNQPVRQLSLGQRMRCELAASLLHNPSILFLDEPTIGLDASTKLVVREIISQINKEQGTTVILTTHDMDDIEALCKRVILIDKGKIIYDGQLDILRTKISNERRLVLDLEAVTQPIEDPDVSVVAVDGQHVELRYNPDTIATAKLIARLASKYPIRDLFVENIPIEALLAKLYNSNPQIKDQIWNTNTLKEGKI